MKRLWAGLTLSWMLALGGCGYRFTARGAPLPEGIRTVKVPVFANKTGEPGVEVIFTQALAEQLTHAGVHGQGDTDGRITGEVVQLYGVPTLGGPSGLSSYRLVGLVILRLHKRAVASDGPGAQEKVVGEAWVSGTEDYLPARQTFTDSTGNPRTVEGDVLNSETNRQTAIRRLATGLMQEGYLRLCTGW